MNTNVKDPVAEINKLVAEAAAALKLAEEIANESNVYVAFWLSEDIECNYAPNSGWQVYQQETWRSSNC
jgi:hypothetical protein